jgi:hypothetical protein
MAYPPAKLNNVLGKYLSNLGMTQLRIAETEKYAHVKFIKIITSPLLIFVGDLMTLDWTNSSVSPRS